MCVLFTQYVVSFEVARLLWVTSQQSNSSRCTVSRILWFFRFLYSIQNDTFRFWCLRRFFSAFRSHISNRSNKSVVPDIFQFLLSNYFWWNAEGLLNSFSSTEACDDTWFKDIFIIAVAEVLNSLMVSLMRINWIAVFWTNPVGLSYISFTASTNGMVSSAKCIQDAGLNVKLNAGTGGLLNCVTCKTLIANGPEAVFCFVVSICPNLPFFVCAEPLSLQRINDNIDYPRHKSPMDRSCETTSAIQH